MLQQAVQIPRFYSVGLNRRYDFHHRAKRHWAIVSARLRNARRRTGRAQPQHRKIDGQPPYERVALGFESEVDSLATATLAVVHVCVGSTLRANVAIVNINVPMCPAAIQLDNLIANERPVTLPRKSIRVFRENWNDSVHNPTSHRANLCSDSDCAPCRGGRRKS